MTCLGGLAALVKPPAKEPIIQTQRLPQTQPIKPLEPQLEPQTVTQTLTPTEAEVLAVAETVAAFSPTMPLANAHPQPSLVIEPEEPTEAIETIAQFHPTPTPINAPPLETAIENEPEAIAPLTPEPEPEAIAPLTPEPEAIAPEPTTLKTRAEQIYAALDAAWDQGTTSYSNLITAVRETTGKGCSKAKIAAWKKERGLISA